MNHLFAVLFFLTVSAPVQAAPGTGPLLAEAGTKSLARKVSVKVLLVRATNEHKKVDERLAKVAKHLKNLRYTGFDLLGTENAQLAVDGKETFSIAGGRKLSVMVLSRDEKRARMRVQLHGQRGKLLDTTVSIRRNGFFVVAGPKTKGGILVLPIFARY